MSSAHRRWTALYRRDPVAVELGGLFLLLFAVQLWTALVTQLYGPLAAVLPRPFADPFLLGPVLAHGLGTAVAAAVYLRVADVSLPLGLPARNRGTGVVAALAPLLLVAVGAVVAHAVGLSLSEVVQVGYGREFGLAFLTWVTLAPAVFASLALGLLYFGAVQRTLRARVGPAHAVGLTVFVVGVVRAMDPPTLGTPSASSLALFLLLSLVAAAVGFTAGIAYRAAGADDPRAVVSRWHLPVLSLGVVGLVGAATEFGDGATLLRWGLFVATVAVGAYGHERTGSLWVGVAALVVYYVAKNVGVYLETVGGVAGF